MHLLTPGLPSPFVHLRVGAVAPYCAGPLTMMMHRLEGGLPSRFGIRMNGYEAGAGS
jgi:hypothetical protein